MYIFLFPILHRQILRHYRIHRKGTVLYVEETPLKKNRVIKLSQDSRTTYYPLS